MSSISEIFKSYNDALHFSRERYLELHSERVENGRVFYEAFFRKLVRQYQPIFSNPTKTSALKRQVERFFGTTQIDFVAIDGTCQKDAFSDFMIFFGGAYGAKGRVSLEGESAKVKYEKWEMNRDVSMVAWIPVPFTELSSVSGLSAEETFMSSDSEKINLSSIHVNLMQLAEIYLAYNVATGSSIDYPRLIMIDQSMSGIMAAVSHGASTNLVGSYSFGERPLTNHDVTIAFAHPFNKDLKVPSAKKFARHAAVLSLFHHSKTQQLKKQDIINSLSLSDSEAQEVIHYLVDKKGLCTYEDSNETLICTIDCRESWDFTTYLFQKVCKKLFLDKDQTALTYSKKDEDGHEMRRWMSPDDIQFLIAVGLRLLVEACWEKKIMLVGVVKDSESRYLTRNYLGVMKKNGLYPELQNPELHIGLLPWTDRIYLESISTYCDDTIQSPWSSVEFDSTFMTLHLGQDDKGNAEYMGVKTRAGEIVAPERLFLRSLCQFFVSRKTRNDGSIIQNANPLTGHVVFVDRLAFPKWDKDAYGKVVIEAPSIGSIKPIVYADNTSENTGQLIMMYLLYTLTRNHFPEVIGYPDPLHKADWGAKSMGKRVSSIIKSSALPFRSKPISKTLRQIRDSHRR